MRTGVSPLVTAVLFTGVVLVGIGTAVTVGVPTVERVQETAAIENSQRLLTDIHGAIRSVAEEGRFSTRTLTLSFSRGRIGFSTDPRELYYEIDTDSGIISSHSSRRIGPLRISANADVTVRRTRVNGTDCYMLENERVRACIRAIDQPYTPPDALRGYWRMDEGTGQQIGDASAYRANGTLGSTDAAESSDPAWTPGIHGTALAFDGSDDRITVPMTRALNVSEAFTVSAWMRPNETGEQALVDADPDDYDDTVDGYTLFQASSGIGLAYGDDTIDTVTGGSLSTGTWHHVAATGDGDTVRLYIDGQQVASTPQDANLTPDTGTMTLGWQECSGCERPFNGTLDAVRVSSRARTAGELRYAVQQRGDHSYLNTSALLVSYHSKVHDEPLDARLGVRVNHRNNTAVGTGSTAADRLGDYVGTGTVRAHVQSRYGLTYDIVFELFSGADFLQVRVED